MSYGMKASLSILALLIAGVAAFPAPVWGTDTVLIADDATGGDCASVGTWDALTKTCVLTTDVADPIEIVSDDITLDCDGHTITGSGATDTVGIRLDDRTGVSIRPARSQTSTGVSASA